MKLVTFEIDSTLGKVERLGALRDKEIIDLSFAFAQYLYEKKSSHRAFDAANEILGKNMLTFVQGGDYSLEAAEITLDFLDSKDIQEIIGPKGQKIAYQLEDISLKAPIQPISIRDTLNCETHFRNCLNVLGLSEIPPLFYERPYYYRTSHTLIAGPEDKIPWPSFGDNLDYELEFAVVIGKEGTNIPAEKADQYIMGYTIFNDISIRDYQSKDISTNLGPSKSKNFMNANILGPCIVTSNDFDPTNIRLRARVNGETWSDSKSSDMYYSFPELIEFISKEETLYPGEIICSGTMAFGSGLELGRYLKPNDVVELEVNGIGILRNQIIK